MTALTSEEMDGQNDRKQRPEFRKHLFDDVMSLDSWSDVCSIPSRIPPVGDTVTFGFIDSHNERRNSNTKRYSGSIEPLVLNPRSLLTKRQYEPVREQSKLFHPSQPAGTGHCVSGGTIRLHDPTGSHEANIRPRTSYHSHRMAGPSKLQSSNQQQSNHGHVLDRNIFTFTRTNVPTNFKELSPQRSVGFFTQPSVGNPFPSASSLFDFGSDPFLDQGEKMKTKLLSVWNNVKFGWALKMKTNFTFDSPIFLLGKCYHRRARDDEPEPGKHIYRIPTMELFKQDFSSRLWFTYRRDFPQLSGSKFTTDCGWGCMLRTGQMMLAQALIVHFLGKDWSVFLEQTWEMVAYQKQIIRWFGDTASDHNPFSIHHLVDIGLNYGKNPGDWYGPASASNILREALEKGYDSQPALTDICIYVAQDCTVYKSDIYDMVTHRPKSVTKLTSSSDSESTTVTIPIDEKKSEVPWQRAVVILVPVRLGGEELNPVYVPCVQSLLAQDCCIGIIGGKPKHSLYFVGWQDMKLVYLDPHYCQDTVNTDERDFLIHTYHCLSPRKMSFSKMDPSCAVGFYCRTKEEFDKFVRQTEEMVAPQKQKGSYPMFVFSEGKSTDVHLKDLNLDNERYLRVRHITRDNYGNVRSQTVESDEFVILGS